MSHQVRANGVHQIDTGSNSVPVLGLRPLSKSLRVHQGQPPPPPGTLELLWWDRVLGSHQGEANRVHQVQTDQDLAV